MAKQGGGLKPPTPVYLKQPPVSLGVGGSVMYWAQAPESDRLESKIDPDTELLYKLGKVIYPLYFIFCGSIMQMTFIYNI